MHAVETDAGWREVHRVRCHDKTSAEEVGAKMSVRSLAPAQIACSVVDFEMAQTTIDVEDTVKIFSSKQVDAPLRTLYATGGDFCRIFESNMDRLYVLSLLLTADSELAEKCFVKGLEVSTDSTPVFKEWAQSWARRAIVTNAIRMIAPRPKDFQSSDHVMELAVTYPPELAAILELPAFDRFAYVLSVLEGYPLRECALLLGTTLGEVNTARMRALQQVVKSVEHRAETESIHSGNQAPRENSQPDGLSRLAVTA